MSYTYEDLGWRTPLVVVCIAGNIVLSLLASGLSLGLDESNPDLGLALTVMVAAIGSIGLLLASIVAVCLWTYQACANGHALAGDWVAPSVSPGYAVGAYFIPFVNLIQPYKAMCEIDSSSRGAPSTDPLLGWWWAAWVLGNIVSNIGSRFESIEAELAGAGIHAISGVLLCLVVRSMHAAQRERRHALREAAAPKIASFRAAPEPALDPHDGG